MKLYNKTHSAPAVSIIALFTLLLLAPLSFAESESVTESHSSVKADAIPAMAGIVAGLNHFPSAEQKETLAAISGDESNSEATRAIADAIHNMEHKAKPEDVAALKEIVAEGSSASEAEKQLAAIVMNISHKAGPEAQKTLETLSQQ